MKGDWDELIVVIEGGGGIFGFKEKVFLSVNYII